MTQYSESLIEYCMWFGKRSRDEAIKLLNKSASPLWQISSEQPKASFYAHTTGDDEDEH